MTKPNKVTAAAAAAAILAAAEQNEVIRSNRDVVIAKALEEFKHFGRMAARGKAQLTRVAFKFLDDCREGFLTAEDARRVYDAYAAGHNEVATASGVTALVEVMGEKSIKSQASILKTFGHRAVVAQGRELYSRIMVLRASVAAEELTASAYSQFAKVNREVAKLSDEQAGTVKLAISDAQILSWITKPKEAKTELEALQAMAKAIGALLKKGDFSGLEANWVSDFNDYVSDFTVNPTMANAKRKTVLLVAAE